MRYFSSSCRCAYFSTVAYTLQSVFMYTTRIVYRISSVLFYAQWCDDTLSPPGPKTLDKNATEYRRYPLTFGGNDDVDAEDDAVDDDNVDGHEIRDRSRHSDGLRTRQPTRIDRYH